MFPYNRNVRAARPYYGQQDDYPGGPSRNGFRQQRFANNYYNSQCDNSISTRFNRNNPNFNSMNNYNNANNRISQYRNIPTRVTRYEQSNQNFEETIPFYVDEFPERQGQQHSQRNNYQRDNFYRDIGPYNDCKQRLTTPSLMRSVHLQHSTNRACRYRYSRPNENQQVKNIKLSNEEEVIYNEIVINKEKSPSRQSIFHKIDQKTDVVNRHKTELKDGKTIIDKPVSDTKESSTEPSLDCTSTGNLHNQSVSIESKSMNIPESMEPLSKSNNQSISTEILTLATEDISRIKNFADNMSCSSDDTIEVPLNGIGVTKVQNDLYDFNKYVDSIASTDNTNKLPNHYVSIKSYIQSPQQNVDSIHIIATEKTDDMYSNDNRIVDWITSVNASVLSTSSSNKIQLLSPKTPNEDKNAKQCSNDSAKSQKTRNKRTPTPKRKESKKSCIFDKSPVVRNNNLETHDLLKSSNKKDMDISNVNEIHNSNTNSENTLLGQLNIQNNNKRSHESRLDKTITPLKNSTISSKNKLSKSKAKSSHDNNDKISLVGTDSSLKHQTQCNTKDDSSNVSNDQKTILKPDNNQNQCKNDEHIKLSDCERLKQKEQTKQIKTNRASEHNVKKNKRSCEEYQTSPNKVLIVSRNSKTQSTNANDVNSKKRKKSTDTKTIKSNPVVEKHSKEETSKIDKQAYPVLEKLLSKKSDISKLSDKHVSNKKKQTSDKEDRIIDKFDQKTNTVTNNLNTGQVSKKNSPESIKQISNKVDTEDFKTKNSISVHYNSKEEISCCEEKQMIKDSNKNSQTKDTGDSVTSQLLSQKPTGQTTTHLKVLSETDVSSFEMHFAHNPESVIRHTRLINSKGNPLENVQVQKDGINSIQMFPPDFMEKSSGEIKENINENFHPESFANNASGPPISNSALSVPIIDCSSADELHKYSEKQKSSCILADRNISTEFTGKIFNHNAAFETVTNPVTNYKVPDQKELIHIPLHGKHEELAESKNSTHFTSHNSGNINTSHGLSPVPMSVSNSNICISPANITNTIASNFRSDYRNSAVANSEITSGNILENSNSKLYEHMLFTCFVIDCGQEFENDHLFKENVSKAKQSPEPAIKEYILNLDYSTMHKNRFNRMLKQLTHLAIMFSLDLHELMKHENFMNCVYSKLSSIWRSKFECPGEISIKQLLISLYATAQKVVSTRKNHATDLNNPDIKNSTTTSKSADVNSSVINQEERFILKEVSDTHRNVSVGTKQYPTSPQQTLYVNSQSVINSTQYNNKIHLPGNVVQHKETRCQSIPSSNQTYNSLSNCNDQSKFNIHVETPEVLRMKQISLHTTTSRVPNIQHTMPHTQSVIGSGGSQIQHNVLPDLIKLPPHSNAAFNINSRSQTNLFSAQTSSNVSVASNSPNVYNSSRVDLLPHMQNENIGLSNSIVVPSSIRQVTKPKLVIMSSEQYTEYISRNLNVESSQNNISTSAQETYDVTNSRTTPRVKITNNSNQISSNMDQSSAAINTAQDYANLDDTTIENIQLSNLENEIEDDTLRNAICSKGSTEYETTYNLLTSNDNELPRCNDNVSEVHNLLEIFMGSPQNSSSSEIIETTDLPKREISEVVSCVQYHLNEVLYDENENKPLDICDNKLWKTSPTSDSRSEGNKGSPLIKDARANSVDSGYAEEMLVVKNQDASGEKRIIYCTICDKVAGLRCSKCKSTCYCSIECQTKHWWDLGHMSSCQSSTN